MNQNAQVIQRFYEAFQRKDYAAMKACYHDDIEFTDPAFPLLKGDEVMSMWQMLLSGSKDIVVVFDRVEADEAHGSATWDARYTFSRTGRRVHNIINAEFTFADGKIIRHVDRFSFYRWSKMAFGVTGWLLGWTPILKNKVQKTVAASLQKFRSQKTPQ